MRSLQSRRAKPSAVSKLGAASKLLVTRDLGRDFLGARGVASFIRVRSGLTLDLDHAWPTSSMTRSNDLLWRQASWHQFQVLTKRSERLVELDHAITWPSNVWMGVSVESDAYTFRIDELTTTKIDLADVTL